MDRLDIMTIEELHREVKKRLEEQAQFIKEIKDDVSELKEQKSQIVFALLGSELNDSNGLVHAVKEIQSNYKDIEERVRAVEDYQIGMKWGTRIIAGLISTGMLVGLVQGIKWIINNLKID